MVQEEFLEMPDPKTDSKPTDKKDDVELTPEEEAKFGKFLNKFLEEDDTPTQTKDTPTLTPSGTPAAHPASSLNIADEINKALDAREAKAKTSDEIIKLRADVDSLKPKARKWYDPFTLFSGVL
jgi:hypothetical protein